MATCKTLVHTSLHFIAFSLRTTTMATTSLRLSPRLPSLQGLKLNNKAPSRSFAMTNESALIPEEPSDSPDDEIEGTDDTVESLLTHGRDSVAKMMKMERRPVQPLSGRWFPYLDRLRCDAGMEEHRLSSGEVVEAMEPYIMEPRMDRFRRVVCGRSYSVCLVIEGLSDFGNVSAAFRSADALGFQSVHVVSCDSSKRYRENRHVSMGAEKWLDIELWDSIEDCFEALKSRGYRIATTHVGNDAVSVYDMDWSCPTAIVVGNESRGVSEEAFGLSDLRCIIPMNGMVDSLNVSVAAGIAMHHAVSDRTTRLGSHGDLSPEERQILLAEFCLRHNRNSIRIATGYAKRKAATLLSPKL